MPEDTSQRLAELRQAPWAIRLDYMPLVREALRAERLDPKAFEAVPTAGPREPNITPGGVAILNLVGMIRPEASFFSMLFGGGGGGLKGFRQELRELVGNDDVKAILLNVDSPGGLSDLVMETAAELREAAAAKPITAVANTMCCSAAYWIASQANEFVVTPSGSAGSVGVYCVHDDWSGYNERLGIDPTYIKAGKFKAEANPDEPLTDEAKAHLQEMVDDCYADFIADVAKGRGTSASAVKSGFGEGRALTARAAVAAGIADRIGTLEQVAGELAVGASTQRRARAAALPAGDIKLGSGAEGPVAMTALGRLLACSACDPVDGEHADGCVNAPAKLPVAADDEPAEETEPAETDPETGDEPADEPGGDEEPAGDDEPEETDDEEPAEGDTETAAALAWLETELA